MKRLFVITLLVLAGTLWATVPVPDGPVMVNMDARVFPNDSVNPAKLRFNYLYEFAQIAQFCADWQLDDVDSAEHGGMIEAETGPLRPVIQTDNTLEAIWVWSRYGQMTGDTARFHENIDKARFYCENFPAWEEESQGGNYYPMHNCAWGIAAENVFRETYGTEDWTWYRDSCAQFMKVTPLSLHWNINRFVTGWCVGWLYKHGEWMGDEEAMDTACARADTLLKHINSIPLVYLREEAWAMSAGTSVWGICNSLFQRDPEAGRDWIAENGQLVDTFQVWKQSGYSWDNSWNVGYCNGHGAMYDVSEDPVYAYRHKWLTHKLLSYDTDDDGAIVASTHDDDTTDMTWVSTYVCMMGLDRLIGEVYDEDAGALHLVGLYDNEQVEPGTVMDLVGIVSNYGRNGLTGVSVKLRGTEYGNETVDMGYLESDTIVFITDWVVPDSVVLTLTVDHAGDDNGANDTLTIRLNKATEVDIVERKGVLAGVGIEANWSDGLPIELRYSIPARDNASLEIYSVDGRLVRRLKIAKPQGRVTWNGTDEVGSALPQGIYFARLDYGDGADATRIVLIR